MDGKEDRDPNATFHDALRELEAEGKVTWNQDKEYVALVAALRCLKLKLLYQ